MNLFMPCHQDSRDSRSMNMASKFFDSVARSSEFLCKDTSKSKLHL